MRKVILITGSTDGIGKLAAIKLAKDGHTLILHGRNTDKLSKVLEEVKAESGNRKVSGFVADFSDLDAVRAMAQQVKEELDVIDVLINNAGVFETPTPLNKDGLDMRFVVNYLAPYVLTKALLPVVKSSAAPRIVNVSSAAQETISPDVMKGDIAVSAREAYGQSKLALLMWSFHLAEQEPTITITALNPGSLLETKMVREAYGKFWASADKGANIIYDLAVASKYKGVTGQYFDNDEGDFAKAHDDAYAEGKIEKLLGMTEEMMGAS